MEVARMACWCSRKKQFRITVSLVLLVCFLFLFSGCNLFPNPEQPREPYAAPFDPEAITVDPATGAEIVSNQVIVRFREGLPKTTMDAVIAGLACIVVGEIPILDVYQLKIPNGSDPTNLVTQFEKSAHVQWAQVNHIIYADTPAGSTSESDPYGNPEFNKQWALHNTGQTGGREDADIDAPEAWAIEKGHPSVTIAILDTGVNYRHEDLEDNLRMPAGFNFDFIDNDFDPMDEGSSDRHAYGHGTAMAGVAVASMNNEGIIGVAPQATFLPVRVIDQGDRVVAVGHDFAVTIGILFAYNRGRVKIINMSLTAPRGTFLLREAIEVIGRRDDVLLIASAGNEISPGRPIPFLGYPAAFPEVMAVAATLHDDHRAPYSNYGDWIDVSAPGGSWETQRIRSTAFPNDDSYGWTGGTSSAAAFVSGVAALIWSLDLSSDGDFDLSASDVREIILITADPIDDRNPGYEHKLGTGRINACKALVETLKQLGVEASRWPIYAESSNDLYIIDVSPQGQDTLIGTIKTPGGETPDITDIAWENDSCGLYGVSFETLYRIDPVACVAEAVGVKLGVADVNALAFDASGNLYTSTDTGYLVVVDKATGRGTVVGSYGSGYESSGDLAFAPNGSLFATVKEPGQSTDILVKVDPPTGKATEIGDTGYQDVFGLFFVGHQLYGVTAENLLITIDTRTGYGSLVRQLSFSAWGAQSEER